MIYLRTKECCVPVSPVIVPRIAKGKEKTYRIVLVQV